MLFQKETKKKETLQIENEGTCEKNIGNKSQMGGNENKKIHNKEKVAKEHISMNKKTIVKVCRETID